MSDKNDAFHRLAAKRIETIIDAIRIFSNLSGPSYEWTPDEVMTYVGQMDEARSVMLARFQDTKNWRESEATLPSLFIPGLETGEEEPAGDPEATPQVVAPRKSEQRDEKRSRVMTDILAGQDDREALAEMVAMQREVIERLQDAIDAHRSKT